MNFQGSKFKSSLLISIIFFVTVIPYLFIHELWRDEIHAWTLTQNSHSIRELFFNTRYEGHPKLWYLILYNIQKFTSDIFYMRLVHLLIAAGVVFVFSYYSPFRFLTNFLFCYGYYIFYEYSAISRNYGIEFLFIFSAAGIYTRRKNESIVIISSLLFFAAQTNIFGTMLSAIFYSYIFLRAKFSDWKKPKMILSACIMVGGIIVSYISMIPPADSGFAESWDLHFNIGHFIRVGGIFFRSMIPFPKLTYEFWNTNIIDSILLLGYLPFLLSVVLLLCCIIFFEKRKDLALFFASGSLAILLFNYVKYFGDQRHHGHLFFLFIICCWMYLSENKNQQTDLSLSRFKQLIQKYFLNFILIVQVSASAVAFYLEWKYPFSNAQAVAAFIKSENLDSLKIAGESDAAVEAVAGLMNKEFYSVKSGRWSKFVIWDSVRKNGIKKDLITCVNDLREKTKEDFLLIISEKKLLDVPPGWTFIKGFEAAIEFDENFFIYRVKGNKM